MTKTIIIINGSGCSGKDTICNIVSKHYNVFNVSSINVVKHIAREVGWNGEKDDKSRKFLSDLKNAISNYNDYILDGLLYDTNFFFMKDYDVMFMHIREPEEIDKYKNAIKDYDVRVCTLLVKRDENIWNNSADSNVENYDYDYIFENKYTLEELPDKVLPFIEDIIK